MRLLFTSIAVVALGTGCLAPKGNSPAEKRQFVNDMRREALSRLYEKRPEAKARIEGAVGYGVFAELETSTGIGGGGAGYGVVIHNETGSKTYMRMIELSGGIGLGIKTLRVFFLFHTDEALQKFTTQGWEGGTEAQAAALLNHSGADLQAAGTVNKGVSVYQLTKSGLYLRAALHMKKFFPDTRLNDE